MQVSFIESFIDLLGKIIENEYTLSKWRRSLGFLTFGFQGGGICFFAILSQSIVENHGCFFISTAPFLDPKRSLAYF